jgi:hypothetical protein
MLATWLRLFVLFILLSALSARPTIWVDGWLVDDYCWNSDGRVGLDTGVLLVQEPWRHTLSCMRDNPVCAQSGYHLLTNVTAGAITFFAVAYTFDTVGNTLVLDLLQRSMAKVDHAQVTVVLF